MEIDETAILQAVHEHRNMFVRFDYLHFTSKEVEPVWNTVLLTSGFRIKELAEAGLIYKAAKVQQVFFFREKPYIRTEPIYVSEEAFDEHMIHILPELEIFRVHDPQDYEGMAETMKRALKLRENPAMLKSKYFVY